MRVYHVENFMIHHHVVLYGGSRSKIYWHHLFIPLVSTASKWSPSSHHPTSGCFPLVHVMFGLKRTSIALHRLSLSIFLSGHYFILWLSFDTKKSPVRQQNAWFDTKKASSTQKCPVWHKNSLPNMHQLTLPLSNIPPLLWEIFFPMLFKYFVFKKP